MADDPVIQLGLDAFAEALGPEWDAASNALQDRPYFLDPEYVTESCQTLDVPAAVAERAVDAAEALAADPDWRRLCWYLHYRLFRSDGYDPWTLRTTDGPCWPTVAAFAEGLDDHAGFVYFLVTLSGIRCLRAEYRDRSIPTTLTDVQIQSVADVVGDHLDRCRREHGHPGLDRKGCYWTTNVLRGDSVRLGRLRFQYLDPPAADSRLYLHAYREDETGRVHALAPDGQRYTADGRQLAPDVGDEGNRSDDCQSDECWMARLDRDGDAITGHPIDPSGFVQREPIELSLVDWSPVLGPGSPHLRVHIPGDEPLAVDRCRDAFEQAVEFFPEYFPERPFRAFVCTSWLLDGQLQSLLSDSSNIVQFQREWYRFPIFETREHDRRLAERIFDDPPPDPTAIEAETTLEENVNRELVDGTLRATAGGGFVLPTAGEWGVSGDSRPSGGD